MCVCVIADFYFAFFLCNLVTLTITTWIRNASSLNTEVFHFLCFVLRYSTTELQMELQICCNATKYIDVFVLCVLTCCVFGPNTTSQCMRLNNEYSINAFIKIILYFLIIISCLTLIKIYIFCLPRTSFICIHSPWMHGLLPEIVSSSHI